MREREWPDLRNEEWVWATCRHGYRLFESIMKQVYEAKVVNEGLSDLEEGRVQDGEAVREEMKKKYGF